MDILTNLEQKICELEEYITYIDSKAEWDNEIKFKWKGKDLTIAGYDWNLKGHHNYYGRLKALTDLQQELKDR